MLPPATPQEITVSLAQVVAVAAYRAFHEQAHPDIDFPITDEDEDQPSPSDLGNALEPSHGDSGPDEEGSDSSLSTISHDSDLLSEHDDEISADETVTAKPHPAKRSKGSHASAGMAAAGM